MRILLIGLLFISSLLSLQAQPKEEIRATWLTTLGGMDWPTRKANSAKGIEAQKNELIRQLDALKAANFNTVLFSNPSSGETLSTLLQLRPLQKVLQDIPARTPDMTHCNLQ